MLISRKRRKTDSVSPSSVSLFGNNLHITPKSPRKRRKFNFESIHKSTKTTHAIQHQTPQFPDIESTPNVPNHHSQIPIPITQPNPPNPIPTHTHAPTVPPAINTSSNNLTPSRNGQSRPAKAPACPSLLPRCTDGAIP